MKKIFLAVFFLFVPALIAQPAAPNIIYVATANRRYSLGRARIRDSSSGMA
jgi:hypothetical protein